MPAASRMLCNSSASVTFPATATCTMLLMLSDPTPARPSRAPFRTSTGSPRSGKGTSITSKSRGTTVAGKTACASAATAEPG